MSAPTDRLFDRLLGALLLPPDGSGAPLGLSAFRPGLAVFESPGEPLALVLLDRAAAGDELPETLRRLLEAQQGGLLFLVLVGGGAEERARLVEADRNAPDPNRLGVYHLGDDGDLRRVAGRTLGLLRKARRWLGRVTPVDAAQIPVLVARSQEEQQQVARFAEALQRRPAPLTIALGSVCVVLFILAKIWGRSSFDLALLMMGANGAGLAPAEPWRLLAHAFLHGSEVHLLLNMLALVSFGSFLEAIVGWPRYLILYGLSALAGGLASAFIGHADVSIGASGAIWGLSVAGLGLVLRPRGLLPTRVAARLRNRLLGVVVINLALSFAPRIDLWAHLGGGAVGLLFALAGGLGRGAGEAGGWRLANGGQEPLAVRAAALLVALLMLGSIAAAVAVGHPWRLPTEADPTARRQEHVVGAVTRA